MLIWPTKEDFLARKRPPAGRLGQKTPAAVTGGPRSRILSPPGLTSSGPAPMGTKPFRQTDEAILKQAQAIKRLCQCNGVRKMIEVVTIVLGLFCAGIFIAHAVDAYLTA